MWQWAAGMLAATSVVSILYARRVKRSLAHLSGALESLRSGRYIEIPEPQHGATVARVLKNYNLLMNSLRRDRQAREHAIVINDRFAIDGDTMYASLMASLTDIDVDSDIEQDDMKIAIPRSVPNESLQMVLENSFR